MTRVRVLDKGVFACFEAGLTDDAGEPVNVEISAVVWNGERLVMASDKDVPGDRRSPVFALACDNGRPLPDTLSYYDAALIRNAQKYEDFALTASGRHVVATTGFDRVDSDSGVQHHYNRLLVWPVEQPDQARLIAESEEHGVRSSVDLRADLGAALNAPYYKIEGLAAVPGHDGGDDRLLFGVREVGANHERFDYVCRVVAAPYRVIDDELVLTGDLEVVYDFDPGRWPEIEYAVGLSSLEYDPHHDRLYFLTSFEVEDDAGNERLGAYMWQIPMADFHAGRAPELVRATDDSAFVFANKAEGLAVLDATRLFIVYDPDRALELDAEHARDRREPHEAPYALLELT